MDYSILLGSLKLRKRKQRKVDPKDIAYLKGIGMPLDLVDFYDQFETISPFEINGVELLSIDGIRIENDNAIPGYLIYPLGYCVIAATMYGDVFCIERNVDNNDVCVYIASHDEIYEGLDINKIKASLVKVSSSFYEFLDMFLNENLASDYYEFITY